MARKFFNSQRSQSMAEFALVAPVLFLIIFGIFDIGRAVIDFVAIQHAANEGGRVASEGYPQGGSATALTPPTTSEVTQATISDSAVVKLVQAPSCPNGPIPKLTTTLIPANQGWVYVSDPEVPSYKAASSSSGTSNLPGGDSGPPSGCSGTKAGGGVPIQVTVIYHYSPVVGVFLGMAGKPILDFNLIAYSNYETEY